MIKNILLILFFIIFNQRCAIYKPLIENNKYNYCKNPARQSPISISKISGIEAKELAVNYLKSHELIENKGHTIQVNYEKGSYVVFKEKYYYLEQFHFHTPSEHIVAGKRFPMEIHLVHRSREGFFLVLSIIVIEGKKNSLITEILNHTPKRKRELKVSQVIDIHAILPEISDFYHYAGSLTTPPYTANLYTFF